MAVTNIPNVQNWTVTPQNGQAGYFTLMNTWLGQSTLVIASLQTAITAQNTANSEINALAIQTENNAIIANGLANFQGAWSGATTYSKGQSVESTSGSKIYYTSKVDSNLNHAVTDATYWLYNPINDKLNTDFSLLTDKTTPADADLIPLSDSASSFRIKKLTWANFKATLNATWVLNDTRAKTALNASGTAPIYACRAWVNFNGIGTVAIRASGNVSSITDNGVGDYTVNFTTAMADKNFSISFGSAQLGGATTGNVSVGLYSLDGSGADPYSYITDSSVRLQRRNSGGILVDTNAVTVSIFR